MFQNMYIIVFPSGIIILFIPELHQFRVLIYKNAIFFLISQASIFAN